MIRKSVNNIFKTKCKIYKLFFATIIFGTIFLKQTEAKGVMLVPLTDSKVYQILRQNDYMDAVPEGRIVTQGIAAVAGFTLGFQKAIGAALLYDIITANITEDAAQNSTGPVYLTQEVCFNSRNARSLDEAEAVAEAYSRLEERDNQHKASVRKSQQVRRLKPKRKTKGKFKTKRKNKGSHRNKISRQPAVTTAEISTAGTQTAEPANINTATADGETNLKAGFNFDTTSSTTTSSDDDNNSVTCLVIQKPKQ